MGKKGLSTKKNRIKYLNERNRVIEMLNSNIGELDESRVREYKEVILKSYEETKSSDKIAIVQKEQNIESYRFQSIGLYQSIKTKDFNDKSFYWDPYFSQVGRAIARGEEHYIHKKLRYSIRGGEEKISRSEGNFGVLNKIIQELVRTSVAPDTILVPVQILPKFVMYYRNRLDWSYGHNEKLMIEDCRLDVFLSHAYAPLNSFLIFNRNAAIWYVLSDSKEDNRTVTIAIGESDKHGTTAYWVEVLAYYKIINPKAFRRVNLSN